MFIVFYERLTMDIKNLLFMAAMLVINIVLFGAVLSKLSIA